MWVHTSQVSIGWNYGVTEEDGATTTLTRDDGDEFRVAFKAAVAKAEGGAQ